MMLKNRPLICFAVAAAVVIAGALLIRQHSRNRKPAVVDPASKLTLADQRQENRKLVKIPLQAIAGTVGDEKKSVWKRLDEVNQLSSDLNPIDVDALLEYLENPEGDFLDFSVKNDILNKLRNQKTLSPEVGGTMLKIFYDREQDMVMRSYALQHLRAWYLYQNQRAEEIKQAFYDGLEERDNEICGVAILALDHLSRYLPELFDAAEIGLLAAELAKDESTYPLSRISAVGVCGNTRTEAALPIVRELAMDAGSLSLRVASIAAVGKLGNVDDYDLLRELATLEKPYSTAALAALKQLEQRN